MKEIANELNQNFQRQMQAEKEQRLNEFKKFKREQNSGQKVLLKEIKSKKSQPKEQSLQMSAALG